MKKIVLKSGLFNTLNQKTKTSKSDLDLRQWLKKELSYFGINVDDPCCANDGIPTVVDTDTRLTNPHVRGGIDLCFDTINVITNVVTPETFCVALEDLNTVTTLNLVNNTLEYKDEAGATNVIDLCPAVKLCETVTTLDSVVLTPGNQLEIQYIGEDGVTQTKTVDLSTLAIDINIASLAYNPLNGEITLTETDSTVHTIDIGPFAETITTLTGVQATGKTIGTYTSEDATVTNIRETISTLVDNLDGTFTYTDESGATTTIDTIEDSNEVLLAIATTINGTTYPIGTPLQTVLTAISTYPGTTNLGYTTSATNGTVTSDTGTDAIIPSATTTLAGLMTAQDKTDLNDLISVKHVPVTTVDSSSIDFTQSGTDNQTITAVISGIASATNGQIASTDGSGNVIWTNPSSGGVVDVTATSPLISTGGSNPDISITSGTTIGNVLGWDGANWVEQVPLGDNGSLIAGAGIALSGTAPNITITNTVTDSQTLSFVSPNLSISGGNSVNLSTIVPATTNSLTNPVNTISSVVNGVTSTTNAVNTVGDGITSNFLTTTVNGVASTPTDLSVIKIPINNLLSATGTNNIDNADLSQVWTWNGLTTNNALTLSSTSTTAAGSLLRINATGAGNTSSGIQVQTASTTGFGARIFTTAMTTGRALEVINVNPAHTAQLVNFNTGSITGINLNVTAVNMTTGTVQRITGTGLTTGTALEVLAGNENVNSTNGVFRVYNNNLVPMLFPNGLFARIQPNNDNSNNNGLTILNSGSTGIGTNTPNSTFEVGGSVGLTNTVFNAASPTLTDIHNIAIFEAGASGTITLPTTPTNRVYYLVNHSGVALTISQAIQTGNGTTTTTLPDGSTFMITKLATKWVRVQ